MTHDKRPGEIELTLQREEDVLADVDIYLAYGMHDEAIVALEQAIRDGPDRPEYRVRLVEAYALAEDASAVQENARIARTRLDSDDHPLLERVAAAEARFPGLEQATGQTANVAVNVLEGAMGSNAPAEDPTLEAKDQKEEIGSPTTGDRSSGRADELESKRSQQDAVAPDRDAKTRALAPAAWLRLSPGWIAALFVLSAIALVFAALLPPELRDLARGSEGSDGETTGSVAAARPDRSDPGSEEKSDRTSEQALPDISGNTVVVGEVSFDANSTALDASFEPLLRDLAETLTAHTGTQAEVIGYAEPSDTLEDSDVLARQRAQAVTNRLIGLGAASHRIRVGVQGSGRPVGAVPHPQRGHVVDITVRAPDHQQ